ncbi:hypothetical protein NFK58_12790 [Citrobacter portucalensis]|uniref:hypothetical protein n=1 Tax=Citrobacter portucalensis TaxID=1639133 RepID=UPI0024304926|nr:hypothetical protein [Citrobacter portucalensis]WFZ22184.1 hypothetical protein NFK58_12790 [Citrobacter portucalensis]
MAKVTFLHELAIIYTEKKRAQGEKAYSTYKNKPDTLHWTQVVNARNRKIMRQIRRCVGKSNRLRARATAYGCVATMSEVDLCGRICRNNRRMGCLHD